MINKTLVTTALESTWPKEGPILFLGSWCCLFSRKSYWSSLDFKISQYHWDDRKKLYHDYKNLEQIYEQYLTEFVSKLNNIHGTDFSERFWRILIGPWLFTCIQVIFDRWYMLNEVSKKDESLKLNILQNYTQSLLVNDMDGFNQAIETDIWNEALYSLIADKFFSTKFIISSTGEYDLSEESIKNVKTKKFSIKKLIKKFSNTISSIFLGDKSVFIIAPHMSIFKLIFLQIKLKQFPAIWYRDDTDFDYNETSPLRENTLFICKPGLIDGFEDVLGQIIFKLIPKIYLEGFKTLVESSKSQGWPKSPVCIFTSNAYASDEVFKCWSAQQIESGSKLVIGQHGGNFGMTPMAIHESHQIKISNKWLSWGWNDKYESKVMPVGNFKSKHTKIRNKSNGDALMALMTLPKYSYYLYSVPIAGQVENYFNDQFKFAEALPNHIRNNLKVRVYPKDREWDQKNRWKSKFHDINFDDNKNSLRDSLKKSRIFIGTYNATTYLETFSANMPSILFWNPEHWEVNAQTKDYLMSLNEIGVLHFSPEDAAKHLTAIWDNVDDWWFSEKVQTIINDFNNQYSKYNPQVIDTIVNNLMME